MVTDPHDPGTVDLSERLDVPNKGAVAHVHGISPDAANRSEHDFYKTPPHATRLLLDAERVDGPAWEPACGDGAISRVLEERGIEIYSSDLCDYGYGAAGVDFLTCNARPKGLRTIITNPPFKEAQEFAERALRHGPDKVILLMRLLWLESGRRRQFFVDSRLSRVWVHSTRVNVSRNGADYGDGGRGGMVAFAWYVWERGHQGPPTLGWLP